jgi:hypothetical protein
LFVQTPAQNPRVESVACFAFLMSLLKMILAHRSQTNLKRISCKHPAKIRHAFALVEIVSQDKTRQAKTRQDKTRQRFQLPLASCLVLSCLVLSCLVLACHCFVLSRLVFVLSCPVLSCFILPPPPPISPALICQPCVAYHLRVKAIETINPGVYWGEHYECGQGCQFCCFKSGRYEKAFPAPCCLCLEIYCCPGVAISGTRNYVMQHYQLQSDPCDNRLIRFNNCLQILSCLCSILAIVDSSFRDLARIIDLIADVTFCIISSCMQAQVNLELNKRGGGKVAAGAPSDEKMER